MRSSNIEVLRIVCMLFIIAGHIIMAHVGGEMGSESYYISQLIRPFFMGAVNAFVLISGYFGIKLDSRKLWKMNDMVTFYSVLGLILMMFVGEHVFSLRKDILYLFPVIAKKYWFITVYFALCLLSPALNFYVEKAEKRFIGKTILTGLVLFVIVPTIGFLLNYESIVPDAGYGIISFCLLYLIGRYIRIYDPFQNVSAGKSLLIYFVCSLTCGLFQIVYSLMLGFSFTSFYSYNTIFVFIAALALFVFFAKLQMGNYRIINYIASYSLCVYIIHIHPLVFRYLFNTLLHVDQYQGLSYVAAIFLLPFPIYAGCVVVEFIRKVITNRIYKMLQL